MVVVIRSAGGSVLAGCVVAGSSAGVCGGSGLAARAALVGMVAAAVVLRRGATAQWRVSKVACFPGRGNPGHARRGGGAAGHD